VAFSFNVNRLYARILANCNTKLLTDSGIIGSLKSGVSELMIPGGFVGLVASGGRIDDINPWPSCLANFLFYFGLAYLLLTVWVRLKSKSAGGTPTSANGPSMPPT